MSWFYPEVHGLTSSDSWWTSKSYNLTSEPPFFVSSTLMFVGIPSLKRWFWQPTPAAPWLLLFSRRGVACTASSSMRCLYCLVEYCWSIRHKCIQMHCDYISREYIILIGGLEHFIFFRILGMITPTDFHIFQRGRYTTNQNRFHMEVDLKVLVGIVNYKGRQCYNIRLRERFFWVNVYLGKDIANVYLRWLNLLFSEVKWTPSELVVGGIGPKYYIAIKWSWIPNHDSGCWFLGVLQRFLCESFAEVPRKQWRKRRCPWKPVAPHSTFAASRSLESNETLLFLVEFSQHSLAFTLGCLPDHSHSFRLHAVWVRLSSTKVDSHNMRFGSVRFGS